MVFSWLFMLRQNLIQYILKLNITILDYMMCLMKINIQINKKKMLKMNKQRSFDMSFRYSRVSWGNKTDPITPHWYRGLMDHMMPLTYVSFSYLSKVNSGGKVVHWTRTLSQDSCSLYEPMYTTHLFPLLAHIFK